MTPEEYQRLKEAEKEHLRSLRALKQAVRDSQRQKKLTDAVTGAVSSPMEALDRHDALVQELAMQTAHNEARLDVALESVSGQADAQIRAQDEETMRKARAAELVRQMRGQVAQAQPEPKAGSAATPAASGSQAPAAAAPPPLPEKTIGRMKR